MKYEDPLLFVPASIDIPLILKEVSKKMEMPIEDFTFKCRKREFVTARQISMCLAKNFTKHSLAKIGSQIGDKDHATVLHACKTINNLVDTKDSLIMDTYVPLYKKLKKLEQDIKNHVPDKFEQQAKHIFNTEK
jgi:chromosomal replication initiator protein